MHFDITLIEKCQNWYSDLFWKDELTIYFYCRSHSSRKKTFFPFFIWLFMHLRYKIFQWVITYLQFFAFFTLTCIKILRQFQTFLLIKEILMTQRVQVCEKKKSLFSYYLFSSLNRGFRWNHRSQICFKLEGIMNSYVQNMESWMITSKESEYFKNRNYVVDKSWKRQLKKVRNHESRRSNDFASAPAPK